MTDKINFTPAKVKALRKAHEEAVKAGKDQFVFEDRDFVTDYAKYLLEYLDTIFKEVK